MALLLLFCTVDLGKRRRETSRLEKVIHFSGISNVLRNFLHYRPRIVPTDYRAPSFRVIFLLLLWKHSELPHHIQQSQLQGLRIARWQH